MDDHDDTAARQHSDSPPACPWAHPNPYHWTSLKYTISVAWTDGKPWKYTVWKRADELGERQMLGTYNSLDEAKANAR